MLVNVSLKTKKLKDSTSDLYNLSAWSFHIWSSMTLHLELKLNGSYMVNLKNLYLFYCCPTRTVPIVWLWEDRLRVYSPQVLWSLKETQYKVCISHNEHNKPITRGFLLYKHYENKRHILGYIIHVKGNSNSKMQSTSHLQMW